MEGTDNPSSRITEEAGQKRGNLSASRKELSDGIADSSKRRRTATRLNLLPFGWGYLYLRKRGYFVSVLVLGLISVVCGYVFAVSAGYRYLGRVDPHPVLTWVYVALGLLGPPALVVIPSAIHAMFIADD